MVLETCRYRFVDGKVITKLFGMKDGDWDIDPGWHHSPKDAKKAAKTKKQLQIEKDEVDGNGAGSD